MTNPTPIQIPQDAKVLYDSIMVGIEPDLLTSELPKLTERYRNESIEDLKARGRRYFQAFQKFKEALTTKLSELGKQADTLNSYIRETLEHLSVEQDGENLEHIQTAIQSL